MSEVLLIESDYPGGTLRMSDAGYIDPVTNLPYDAWLVDLPTIERRLEKSVSIGDFSIVYDTNPEHWRDTVFSECRIYRGDSNSPKSQFSLIAKTKHGKTTVQDGVTKFTLINGEELLKPVHNEKDADGNNKLFCIGNQRKTIPQLIESFPKYKYRIHDGAWNGTITKVYDKGLDVTNQVTMLTAQGAFEFNVEPAGAIRFDANSTNNTAETIINDLAAKAGITVNLSLQQWQKDAKISLKINGDTTYKDVFDKIAKSIGAYFIKTRTGEYLMISPVATNSVATLTDDITSYESGEVAEIPAQTSITVNYLFIDAMGDGDFVEPTPDGLTLAGREPFKLKNKSVTVGSADTTPFVIDTLLIDDVDANQLLTLLQSRKATKKRIVRFDVAGHPTLQPGETATINRWDVQGDGIITATKTNKRDELIRVEVAL